MDIYKNKKPEIIVPNQVELKKGKVIIDKSNLRYIYDENYNYNGEKPLRFNETQLN